jgi:hypothetical protein
MELASKNSTCGVIVVKHTHCTFLELRISLITNQALLVAWFLTLEKREEKERNSVCDSCE